MIEPTFADREEAKKIFLGESDVYRFGKGGLLTMPESQPDGASVKTGTKWTKELLAYSQKHRGVELAVLDLVLKHAPNMPIYFGKKRNFEYIETYEKSRDQSYLNDIGGGSITDINGENEVNGGLAALESLHFELEDLRARGELDVLNDYLSNPESPIPSVRYSRDATGTIIDRDEATDHYDTVDYAIDYACTEIANERAHPNGKKIADFVDEFPDAVAFIEQHRAKLDEFTDLIMNFKPRNEFETFHEFPHSEVAHNTARIRIHLDSEMIQAIAQSLIGEGRERKANS